jgi:hypothetical protein
MSLERVLSVAFSLLMALAILMVIERVIIPRIPHNIKNTLVNDIVARIVVLGSILGFIMLKHPVLSFIGFLLGFVYLTTIKESLSKNKKAEKEMKNTLNSVTLPINSNDVKEQEVKVEAELVKEEDNKLEPIQVNKQPVVYDSELALGEVVYLPNNDLEKQNKAKVSRNELESRFAIYLEGSDQFKHNDISYNRNNSKYVTGELLERGLPNDTDNCVSVKDMKEQENKEGFANLPRRYFNDKGCSCGAECKVNGKCNCGCKMCNHHFTTPGQFKDAQSNLVGCGCDGKKDIPVTCLNQETNALYSAKRQYSSQGTSSDVMNPSGFNL